MIHVGMKVYTTVSVLGERVRMAPGIVVAQSFDGSVSDVDVMSLHGGRPWIHHEVTSSLEPFTENAP